jgi:hypothetical protein
MSRRHWARWPGAEEDGGGGIDVRFDISRTESIRAADLRPGDVFLRRPGLPMRVRRIQRRRNGLLRVLGWAVEPQPSMYSILPSTSYAPEDPVERVVEHGPR